MIGVGGTEVLLVALLATLVLLLAYRLSRRSDRIGSPGTEVAFGLLVAIGALIAPQIATVILLAMIYQQLVLNARKG